MNSKAKLGVVLLVVSTVAVFALAGMGSQLPSVLASVGVLGMAGGSLLVGMAGEEQGV